MPRNMQLSDLPSARSAVRLDTACTTVLSDSDKIFFDVLFEQKEIAKATGLRWDNTVRKWYAPDAEIAKAFSALLEKGAPTPAEPERYYFKVPFLQKDHAKAMGMRFDGARKLWFAPNPALASDAAKTFEKIDKLRDDNDARTAAQSSI
jgi:hypothetical protein